MDDSIIVSYETYNKLIELYSGVGMIYRLENHPKKVYGFNEEFINDHNLFDIHNFHLLNTVSPYWYANRKDLTSITNIFSETLI